MMRASVAITRYECISKIPALDNENKYQMCATNVGQNTDCR